MSQTTHKPLFPHVPDVFQLIVQPHGQRSVLLLEQYPSLLLLLAVAPFFSCCQPPREGLVFLHLQLFVFKCVD